jgi:hypothetical protein
MKLVSQKFLDAEKINNKKYNEVYKKSEIDYKAMHRATEVEKDNEKLTRELDEKGKFILS